MVTSKAKGFVPPPPRPTPPASADPKVASLEQRRQSIENAIELVQRSADSDSPFQQRIAILNTTLDSIEAEIRAATPFERRELPGLPSTPIGDISVTLDPVPDVRFSIGSMPFEYAEEIDWAERGTQIVRGDLLPVTVDIEPLIPESISGAIRAD